LFVDKANGNYTLQSTSPAKNTGNNTPIQTYSIDLAGKNRIEETTVDMGAYEYKAPTVTKIDNIPGNDDLLEIRYFTLNGLEVKKPLKEGFYVVKKIFSKKILTEKTFINQ